MTDIEKHNPQLGGVLPRNYQIFNGTRFARPVLRDCRAELPHDSEAPPPNPKSPPDARSSAATSAFGRGNTSISKITSRGFNANSK